MENKSEAKSNLLPILIPAISTLLVALIGLGTAIYQSELPIRLTQVAQTALASTPTAAPFLASLNPPDQKTPLPPGTFVENLRPVETAVVNTLTPLPTATVTSLPPTNTATAPPITFSVENDLVLPVKISIGNVYQSDVAAGSTETFTIDSAPVTVDWDLVRITTSSGREIGDDMSGIWKDVVDGDELVIDNIIVDQYYFYPIITNPGATDCYVTINKGWENEVITNSFIPALTDRIGMGYYKLFTNSNITLTCGTQFYWWGTLPDPDGGPSFYGLVTKDTGVIEFTLIP